LRAYRGRQWDEARAAFAACLAINPEDGPALLFTKRVEMVGSQTPTEQWDGVWTMTEK
jgi:adenylate cyclase